MVLLRTWVCTLAAALVLCAPALRAAQVDARVKAFGSAGFLPEEDLQRRMSGTPSYDGNLDVRLMLRQQTGDVTWIADQTTTLLYSDAGIVNNLFGVTLDQSTDSDATRFVDLTWVVDETDHRSVVARLDRFAMEYRGASWGVTVGRQAVSWGNGMVFQPLDLFSPFAPTTVDQDYKAGDDLLLAERLLNGGGDLQLLAVGRRDLQGDRTLDVASIAGKWHGFVGTGELELVAGHHYRDQVYAMAVRIPLGGALVRSDLVATRLESGTWKLSGILNADYSLLLTGRNVYLFAEYFHNAFGVHDLPETPFGYPLELTERLARGELFNLMRNYLAVGGSVEWHALWTQSLTLIANLDDTSSLLQTQITYIPGDHQTLDVGVALPLGSAGDEFGGVPVATDAVTVGGGTQLYLRWVYYF